jgi:hypothetical protein
VLLVLFSFNFLAKSIACDNHDLSIELKDIYDGMKSRRDFFDPFKAEIRISTSQTQKYLDQAFQKGATGLPLQWDAQYSFAVRGNRIWESKVETNSSRKGGPTFLLFNGKHTVWPHSQDKCFNISSGPPKFHLCLTPAEVMGENSLFLAIEKSVVGKESSNSLIIRSARLDGQNLLVVVFYPQSKWTNELVFIPSNSYAIRSMVIKDENGTMLLRANVSEFYGSESGFYPRKGTVEKFTLDSGSLQTPQMIQRFDVTLASCDPSIVSDSIFAFPFPDGSQFYDTDLGVWVRDIDLAESHLNNVVAELRHNHWPWYIYFSGIVVVIFVSAIFLRWRNRSR